MSTMSTLAPTVAFLMLVSTFTLGSWGFPQRVSARDRWGLVSGFVTAITGFAVASLLINWVTVPAAVWPAGVVLLAIGGVGATLRWPQVPWFAGTRPVVRAVVVASYWSICAVVIGVAIA